MNNKQTAGKSCKKAGLSGIIELSKLSGKPQRTLYDLFNNNRLEFNLLVYGAVLKRAYEALNE